MRLHVTPQNQEESRVHFRSPSGEGDESPTGFCHRPETDEVVGEVVDFDADGTLTIRVGDSLAMVDTTDDPPLGIIGRKVAIRPHSIELHPYHL
jgi:hypothetical protein